MNTLLHCCLITLRYDSDAGQSMALCSCAPIEAYRLTISEAFSHRIFSRLDDSTKHIKIAQSLERFLLEDAGVSCKNIHVIDENFFIEQVDEPIVSYWIQLDLQGKINPRKSKIIESTLRQWSEIAFPKQSCCLPSPRPIPLGTANDLGALRAGWRAEAQARGFHHEPVSTQNLETDGDGFPEPRARAKKK